MIKIKNIYKKYDNKEVLKGLTLDIDESEILVILGKSGAGKSVLLRQIIGLDKPDKGTIEINDTEITSLSEKEFYKFVMHMGMLFQNSALFDSLNIESNVGFYLNQNPDPGTNRYCSKKEIKDRVMEALKMVGLENELKKMPSELSGGMKKRAALARLIAYRPKILLYDEPTTGLDPITAHQINDLIIKTQNELNGTSIIVTHDIHSALYIADKIALHDDGKILYVEKPEDFMKINDPTIQFLKDTLTNHPCKRYE